MMFFTVEKLEKHLQFIQAAIHRQKLSLPGFKYTEGPFDPTLHYCGTEPGPHQPDFDDLGWQDFAVGDTWGGYDRQAWFRAWVDIPPEWQRQKVALRCVVGPRDGGGSTAETLLYVNGRPLQGLDIWHEEAWLPPELLVSGRIFIALKAWSGVLAVPDRRRFKAAELVLIEERAERYYYLASALLGSARLLDENDLRRVRLLDLLDRSLRTIDFYTGLSAAFYTSLEEAGACLAQGLRALQTNELKPTVTGVGHSHIDMAWLWRLDHSREKASRTFSTVLHLMRQYPEYRYMHSSPQLYQYLKEDYPSIYEQVRARAAEGRWEITGGMWVEADTNLTGGESLVRQFLLGKRFMREEFGVETRVLWLPDVFGYSAALPQIVRKCGLKYFLTSKISWSQFNRFPNDTFQWRGIDGSELLTHFVTTPEDNTWFYTYNGRFEPAEVKGIWDNYRQKTVNDELLLLYGWGDGGGGPTREMLESARALENVPGMPRVQMGGAEAYFERLERRLQGQSLPVWDGELYLEYHRGTYTSQAQIKRFNRKAENLLHEAEWLCSLAGAFGLGQGYPAQELRESWELLLLNQFHDILPGSSIKEVYQDSARDYARITELGEAACVRAQQALLAEIPSQGPALVVFNSLSWPRSGLLELPAGTDCSLPSQLVQGEEGERLLVQVGEVPALGCAALPLQCAAEPVAGELSISPHRIETPYYSLRLNPIGQIVSLYDKRCDREVLAPGERGNVFQAFEDRPLNFDAWDIDIYYQDKQREVQELLEAVVEENGPLRGVLRLRWQFGSSTITQRLTVYQSSPRLDFRTHVDWQERQVLLKVAFPVAVRAARATYEIQFGSVERPTHWNTSWDYARFETPAQRWVDLSEGGYGVALLNDCKYGHDIKDHTLRLTLLKSAVDPDPTADQGEHTFTYSLLPHGGDWREGGVVQQAYDLNLPLKSVYRPGAQGGSLPQSLSMVQPPAEHVVVETVKKAENGEAWVVRVYEAHQRRARGLRLAFPIPLQKAVECNLVEEEEVPAVFDRSGLVFDILPFEIKTFKVWFAPPN